MPNFIMYKNFEYFLFYKPYQVLSQFSAEGNKKTLADFLPNISKDVYPVGRLDFDSEGLLFLTNDKQLNEKLLHPKFAHAKTYWAQVEGKPDASMLAQLNSGTVINVNGLPYKTKPAKVFELEEEPEVPERNPPIRFRKSIPTSWLSITINEGKNRQVRKMTASVNLPTLRLIRYSIGNVTIANLLPGQYAKQDKSIIDKLLISF